MENIQDSLRVSQLDASELDAGLFELLKSQLSSAFKYFKPGALVKFDPEVNALLRAVIWKYSVDTLESTIGQRLLQLKYKNEVSSGDQSAWISKRQKLLYALCTVGGAWIHERTDDLTILTANLTQADQVRQFLRYVGIGWRIVSLLNFLLFLSQGRYQFLWERILRIRPVYPSPKGVRQVGFEYMDRELLWHGFAEFLFFLLPLINFRRMRNVVMRRLMPVTASSTVGERDASCYKECVICSHWPYNPQEIGCKHLFCYYCIQSNYMADPSYSCPSCGHSVDLSSGIRPVTMTIVEPV